jgi:peptidoglycan/xylan/chitin deacetylase (PgdA/CDA1 family)
VGIAVCAGLVASAVVAWPRNKPTVEVVVDHRGERHLVRLGGHPTVGMALRATGVQLVPAHLLGALSHQPIAGHDLPPTVLLDGNPATPASLVVGRRATVQVVDAHDTVEPTEIKPGATIPPPPLPRVMRKLWHPGRPGLATEATVGAVSGEILTAQVKVKPSKPMPVTDEQVALSFDDGPWPDTPQFLMQLQEAGIKAMFCMVGRQVTARPDLVNLVAAAGMTICNHTQNHNQHLDTASPLVVDAEVHGGARALTRVLGQSPAYYRPPGGHLSNTIEDAANGLDEQVVTWSVDPADYKKPGVDKIVSTVLAQVRPGAIILLHDGGGDRSQTLAALPKIIAALKAEGYRFTTPDAVSPVPLGAAG